MDFDRSRRPYLTPTEVAQLLRVSPVTVRQWALRGLLPAETTPGGHRRFLRHEVERFARDRGISLQHPEDGRLRVLIVDDDAPFAGYLVELISGAGGAEVEWAGDGFEAGRRVLSARPHVVLLDLMMPGMNGIQVCRRLKEDPNTRSIRVIAMTGYHTEESEAALLDAGAEVCLAKPIEPATLLSLLGLGDAAAAGVSGRRSSN